MNKLVVLKMIAKGAGAVLLIVALASAPIWLQNNHTQLLREQRELQAESVRLHNEIALLKKEANLLVGRERLEKMGIENFGLGYHELPIAVMEEGR